MLVIRRLMVKSGGGLALWCTEAAHLQIKLVLRLLQLLGTLDAVTILLG